jgi:hypothetical protein
MLLKKKNNEIKKLKKIKKFLNILLKKIKINLEKKDFKKKKFKENLEKKPKKESNKILLVIKKILKNVNIFFLKNFKGLIFLAKRNSVSCILALKNSFFFLSETSFKDVFKFPIFFFKDF